MAAIWGRKELRKNDGKNPNRRTCARSSCFTLLWFGRKNANPRSCARSGQSKLFWFILACQPDKFKGSFEPEHCSGSIQEAKDLLCQVCVLYSNGGLSCSDILVCFSRTQKQIDQVVKELKRNTLYRPRMSILGSRDFYCVNPEAIAEPNRNDAWYVVFVSAILKMCSNRQWKNSWQGRRRMSLPY